MLNQNELKVCDRRKICEERCLEELAVDDLWKRKFEEKWKGVEKKKKKTVQTHEKGSSIDQNKYDIII